ncbi:MAG: pro-sigmaK processing inhibitor BofA family protein [Bacilli bacterium]
MLKKIMRFISKIVLSSFILYSYNIIVPPNLIVPINVFSVSIICLLGLPGLCSLILILYTFY